MIKMSCVGNIIFWKIEDTLFIMHACGSYHPKNCDTFKRMWHIVLFQMKLLIRDKC